MPSRLNDLTIEPAQYRAKDGRAVSALRGRLGVPMRRSAPGGARVELAFYRLPASNPRRSGDPVVFLTGGPGLSGIAAGRGRLFDLFERLRRGGDVILLDQRGCGESTPSLACADPLRVPIDQPAAREAFTEAAIEALQRCAEELSARGIDLAAFNANESADDVAELAHALGYARVSLLGWSYGSHLAMAVMRRHPSVVSRAVLAGPEGPDQTWKLPSRVHAQLNRLSARTGFDATRAVRSALAHAERGVVRVPWDENGAVAAISRFDVEWVLSEALGDTRVLARLPRVLSNMAHGDFADLARDPLLRAMVEDFRGGLFLSPLRYCVDCASGTSAARRARIEAEARGLPLGRTIDWPFPEICAAFGRPDLGDEFRATLRSNVRTLFITGTLDCRTPAENLLDLMPAFLSPRHLVVDDAGHGDLLRPRGVHAAVAEFLHSGNLDVSHVAPDRPFEPEPARATLVYDGECAFCRRQVEQLRRRSGDGVDLVPFQSAGERFPGIPAADFARSVHLVMPDGRVATGAEAVLRASASGSRAARTALFVYRRIPGVRLVAELAYRWVARNRRRLAR